MEKNENNTVTMAEYVTPSADVQAYVEGIKAHAPEHFEKLCQTISDRLALEGVHPYGIHVWHSYPAWECLNEFVMATFGEAGEKMVADARAKLNAMKADPATYEATKNRFNHWRVWHIDMQVKHDLAERERLLEEIAKFDSNHKQQTNHE